MNISSYEKFHLQSPEFTGKIFNINQSNRDFELVAVVSETEYVDADVINGVNSYGKPFVTIPAFSESGGMVQRQCTGEYKINTVKIPEKYVYPLILFLGVCHA